MHECQEGRRYTVFISFSFLSHTKPHLGTPITKMRIRVFIKALNMSDGVFSRIHDGIEAACDKVIRVFGADVIESMNEVFVTIHQNFGAICANPEQETPEGRELRQKLAEYIPKARAVLAGPIRQALEECRN